MTKYKKGHNKSSTSGKKRAEMVTLKQEDAKFQHNYKFGTKIENEEYI